MKIYQLLRYSVLLIGTSAILSSCNQEDDKLDVPSTYEFTRSGASTVDVSGQVQRLDMLSQLGTYMKSVNTVGSASLDENLLKDMFRNQNNPFTGQTYSKDLKSKCFAPDTTMFLQFLEEAALVSQAVGTASNGTAGVLVEGSADLTKGYRVTANGLELAQVVEKGLMGAVFYYQAMEIYLSADRMGLVGNDDFAAGENYTDMEHYFDEAFGYFGAPTDFPSSVSIGDSQFWAKYCNTRNEGLYPGINDDIATAFRTARAAITAKDYEARDAAIEVIMEKWAIVSAASAIDYLDQALSTSGTSEYKRHHVMSEAIGFMLALKYHFNGGNSKFPPHYTYSHIEDALMEVGLTSNLYTVTDTQLQDAISHVRMAFPTGEIK
ncbi:MAG: DUF4856 domain-containing protein [Flavobacteriales bacterium]|nr:DUF4856 domain-containing protein [Flavobacteriales bacterium]